MNPSLATLDRLIAEAQKLRLDLERNPGHRAALARGAIDGAVVAFRQARQFLMSPPSGTWTKTT